MVSDGRHEHQGQLPGLDQGEDDDQHKVEEQQLGSEMNIANNVNTVILWVEIPHVPQPLKILLTCKC